MTDHGNLFGAIEFYQEAEKAGIKPIIGCEMYMALGKLSEKQAASARDAAYHFTLLARDETGYRNLVKLSPSPTSMACITSPHRQGGAGAPQRRPAGNERLPQGRDQSGHSRRSTSESARRA